MVRRVSCRFYTQCGQATYLWWCHGNECRVQHRPRTLRSGRCRRRCWSPTILRAARPSARSFSRASCRRSTRPGSVQLAIMVANEVECVAVLEKLQPFVGAEGAHVRKQDPKPPLFVGDPAERSHRVLGALCRRDDGRRGVPHVDVLGALCRRDDGRRGVPHVERSRAWLAGSRACPWWIGSNRSSSWPWDPARRRGKSSAQQPRRVDGRADPAPPSRTKPFACATSSYPRRSCRTSTRG